MIYRKRRPHPETVEKIIREAVELECEFLTDALPVSLIGMNEKLMCQYIRFVAGKSGSEEESAYAVFAHSAS